ncbi:MAG: TetR/AcrR family transcriptional regulator [Phenylobacterium sp.]|jgi:AcrR family transcriptional regulator|uniref:Nucleoid occlusion factor SlmA n=1 Tax=Brevundimonas mediterranea TaxID=74329 RepID=A0A6G7EFR7_9CAUL|nr:MULTISPECIES: TetR/AcrR family transcriptional regulator [Brevundimonas]MBU4195343.1 TetR/AcrR family transcriptional regulator [Alphaproteobacteria bacterium]MDZ4052216.1 TetR/AcrR family transcriptional regulator [Phenylobacterium sp.]OGN47726.1 MAG: TetR family transcriptional regulator [Caulobacterales bacterium RIFCSPHIGHO2_12_FULL_68_13]OYX72742.1 MAG: TetR family transcriptional regulator [Brevundimonas sp. 32-68-21]EDX80835.1 transcriptional regulator, TetR family protein [Brevundim
MDITTRRRAPDDTRAEIIEKALEVAAELGASGFTLDAVAARTTVSKGALLHHFPSKIALLEGMIDHLGEMHTDSVLAEAARDPEPYGRNARAYLRATVIEPFTPQDISIGRVVMAACAIEPTLAQRWNGWIAKVKIDDPSDPVGADDALMLRLIADGLWMSDIFGTHAVSLDQRRALLSLLTPGHLITANEA